MRLIDADEIVKETWGVVIKDMFHMDETVDVISRKDIDNAPTVKAIPIEWIEKWAEKFYKVINGTRYYMGDGYDTVWDMLEDWEKENEID